jgi:hypothetical protein
MRAFGRPLSWRTASMHLLPALSGANVRDWLRRPGQLANSRRSAAALFAAFLAAALAIVVGLRAIWINSVLALPQGRIIAPANNQEFGWIERAIAQCEAEAARNGATLYFLVIPVVASDGEQLPWMSKSNGTVGPSILLLGSQTTLDGLRAGSLRLASRPFNFSILEPSTSRIYKWKPALGVSKFAIREANTVAAFQPGFEIPVGGEPRWADGGAIPRQPGTCYWTGALIRG